MSAFGWVLLFLISGLIGLLIANLTASSIKGFTKDKVDKETGDTYSVYTSAGELYSGVMAVNVAIAMCAIVWMIIQKINEYNAKHPRPSLPPPIVINPARSPQEERLLDSVTAGSIGALLGLVIGIGTAFSIKGFTNKKTQIDANGEEHKYSVITNDGLGYIAGLALGLGIIAFAIAWHRETIQRSIVRFFPGGQSTQQQPTLQPSPT